MRKILLLALISIIAISCQKESTIEILGTIPNLPDGTLYLYNAKYNVIIDSTKTINGRFDIKHVFPKNSAPLYLGLKHTDKQSFTRTLHFPSEVKFETQRWNPPAFLSDPVICINGNIQDFSHIAPNYTGKLNHFIVGKITAGKQTDVFYKTELNLFKTAQYKDISNFIKAYPYSYHLLYSLDLFKDRFTGLQIKELLKLFDKDVKNSQPYKDLLYIAEQRQKNSKS